MTSVREDARLERVAGETDLRVHLDAPLPASVPLRTPTAIFCCGTCFHRHRPVDRLEIAVGDVLHRVMACRMPRLDLFQELHPALCDADPRADDPLSPEDPEVRCYRSGFWATIPIPAPAGPAEIEVRVTAQLSGGEAASAHLGTIAVTEPSPPPTGISPGHGAGLIAICMATFDPDPDLFRVQVASIRAQTDTNWVCVISDDCSEQERFERIRDILGDDPRFTVSRSDVRLGFYRNFERALMMAPPQAELVALSDQDDRWYPDKLEALREAIEGAQLAYSDQRLVDPAGRVSRETLWRGRRNNHTNFTSLLIANTIVGASALMRRDVVDAALPFPEGPGWEFHDHWVALVALATGKVSYVDRPLYDYVQHAGAILGRVAVEPEDPRAARVPARMRARLRHWRTFFGRWRAAYFAAYLQLELQAQVLLVRCTARMSPSKRRAARRLVAAGRAPWGVPWLALRSLRRFAGRNETLGTETLLAKGVLWRFLIALRVRRRERPLGARYTASPPAFDPETISQARVRRWLASR